MKYRSLHADLRLVRASSHARCQKIWFMLMWNECQTVFKYVFSHDTPASYVVVSGGIVSLRRWPVIIIICRPYRWIPSLSRAWAPEHERLIPATLSQLLVWGQTLIPRTSQLLFLCVQNWVSKTTVWILMFKLPKFMFIELHWHTQMEWIS